MRRLIYALSLLLPWSLRRRILCRLFGYQIDPTSRIGLSWILPTHLIMKPFSHIGHLTVCKGVEVLSIGEHGSIGNGNWITGYPVAGQEYFAHQVDRKPMLEVGAHAAITHRHLLDCTNTVIIGRFSTFAGYHSQILTHSVDIAACRQSSAPVTIGEYCFVGTNVVLLGGSVLPAYSVLGAKSLLNKAYTDTYMLYGGVPAKPIQKLAEDLGYFRREVGHIH